MFYLFGILRLIIDIGGLFTTLIWVWYVQYISRDVMPLNTCKPKSFEANFEVEY